MAKEDTDGAEGAAPGHRARLARRSRSKLGGGRMGAPKRMRLEAAFCEFGGVLRFEARVLRSGSFAVLGDVLREATAGFGVFSDEIPIMCLFFHFVALVFEAEFLLFAILRFEAIFGFALFGS